MIDINIAFSCTCQPNKNEVNAHITRHRTNCRGCAPVFHNLTNAGTEAPAVHSIVTNGDTEGNTAWENSWTRPPVIDAVEDEIFKCNNLPEN